MKDDERKDLEDYLNAVESQLNLLKSTPLTDGGTFPWTPGMVDQQLFLQNQIDIMHEELAEMDEADDKELNKLLSKNGNAKAIVPKG